MTRTAASTDGQFRKERNMTIKVPIISIYQKFDLSSDDPKIIKEFIAENKVYRLAKNEVERF